MEKKQPPKNLNKVSLQPKYGSLVVLNLARNKKDQWKKH